MKKLFCYAFLLTKTEGSAITSKAYCVVIEDNDEYSAVGKACTEALDENPSFAIKSWSGKTVTVNEESDYEYEEKLDEIK